MMDALADDLSYIASEAPEEKLWRGRVPTINLAPRSVLNKVRKRLGWSPVDKGRRPLMRAVHSKTVTCIFVHWLDFALRYADVWASTNKPLFIHCHGSDVTWKRQHYDQLPAIPAFSEDYPQQAFRLSERAILIANSRCTAAKLENIGVPSGRIRLHYFGVPTREGPPRPFESQEVTLLFLGRLVDFKGPDLTIKAFELACDRGLQGKLLIAGNGPLAATCALMRIRSKYSRRIHLLGTVDSRRAVELQQAADIFTAHSCIGPLSNQEEGFGVAFVEAMAAGLPIVTGRTEALEEVVEDGVTGVLFPPGDVEAHANAILTLATNPKMRLQMGRAAGQRASTLFPIENDTQNLRRTLGIKHLP
jgi:colanic acid/amylovoran biosynthesis glycosyltransferase